MFLFTCALSLFVQEKSPNLCLKGCYFIELNTRKIAWNKIKYEIKRYKKRYTVHEQTKLF